MTAVRKPGQRSDGVDVDSSMNGHGGVLGLRLPSGGLLRESNRSTIGIGLFVIAVVIGAILTPSFLTSTNIKSIFQNAGPIGIVAVAMTPMAMSGNFVSLGTQQSTVLAAMSFVYLVGTGMEVALAIAIVLLGLAAIGALQGCIVAMGLNPVITTLATGVIILGVIERINTGGAGANLGSHSVSWGSAQVIGIPIIAIVFVAVTIVTTVFMSKTVAGRRITLAGANSATARLAGISLPLTTISVFVLASLGMAIAGVMDGAKFGVASTIDFNELTIDAVAAILVGGNSIAGGSGSPLRSAIGAVVIAAATDLMTLNGFSPGIRIVVEGAIILGFIAFFEALRRGR